MQLKTKLTAGFIFLFLVILAVGVMGIYSIYRLAADSEGVLRNNQNSVLYCGSMLESLDARALDTFDSALVLQEHNITEPGEGALTATLRTAFESLRRDPGDSARYAGIRSLLYRISDINQEPILRKSTIARIRAHHAIQWMSITVAVLTLVTFIFVLNFPGAVSRPVQEQSEAKTNFIATISHELKTPLSSIKMAGRLLQDERVGTLNEEQQELVSQVSEDANRLLAITGELLHLTQAETGHIQLQIASVAPAAILDVAIRAVVFQARQKNIQLITDVQDEDLRIYADAEKSSWVLINYLTNAIRYSRLDGLVTVTVTGLPGGAVSFVVRDQGPGIEARYLPKLFDKYFRVPGKGDDTGSGLGLAISKEFIEAQGGSVGVWSEPGFGSAFSFELPGAKAAI
jgi:signal transduction histidine kinase